MSTVWISKESWLTIWNAIRNIQIRMDHTVLKPSVCLSGQGASARLRLDLPLAAGEEADKYAGPFKVTVNKRERTLTIGKGFLNAGGEFSVTEETVLSWDDLPEIEGGWLCVGSNADERFAVRKTPDAEHYPIAKITKAAEKTSGGEKKESVTFYQLHVPVAILPGTFDGPFKVSVNAEENTMTVASGPVLANGEYFETEETELALEEGYVCVHIELAENGEWSDPEIFAGAKPGALNVPVALISHDVKETDDGETAESWRVTQFRVPRAVFVIAEYECPITGDSDESR